MDEPSTRGQGLARHELDAYAALVVAHRDIADRLVALAEQMASYRDLPLAPHDEAAMSDTLALSAFESFIQAERELATLLQQLSRGEEDMLEEMTDRLLRVHAYLQAYSRNTYNKRAVGAEN